MFKIPIKENTSILLPEIVIGRVSAFEGLIVNVPDTYENVQIAFGQQNGTIIPVNCNTRPGGEWFCYANGAYFQNICNVSYHVTAKTSRGDSTYLGSGRLRVVQSILNTNTAAVPVIPDDCYVRGANGLYYKVVASLDEDGVPFMTVDRNGVTK